MSKPATSKRIRDPVLFVCDLQDKFRNAIYEFPQVLAITQKLLQATSSLKIPIVATTQNRAKLGETCSELEIGSKYPTLADVDKTAFSMWIPEVQAAMEKLPHRPLDVSNATTTKLDLADIVIVGIETHICVLQTTLDALAHGHRVWVVQDAVSSCNKEERSTALERMRQEGARITTSESLLFEMMGDAKSDSFRDVSGIVKNTKEPTQKALKAFCNL